MKKQKTIKDSFSLKGKGLHTGLNLTVTFNPAPAGYGYRIQRTDIDGKPVIRALAENVRDTMRGTVLCEGDVRVSTVEHGMAALYSAGIDNCLIEVNGPEFPILDGSAAYYTEQINKVGTVEQDAPKEFFDVTSRIEYTDESTGASIVILPADSFSAEVEISFQSKVLGSQKAVLEHLEDFGSEIAGSRTFVFVREIEPLLGAGLIKGGDLDNAIVIYENEMPQERLDKLAEIMGVPGMDASKLGYLNHRPLAWPNEPARHKLLDLVGDLALVGRPIRGRVIATKPGHTVNNKFARLLREHIK